MTYILHAYYTPICAGYRILSETQSLLETSPTNGHLLFAFWHAIIYKTFCADFSSTVSFPCMCNCVYICSTVYLNSSCNMYPDDHQSTFQCPPVYLSIQLSICLSLCLFCHPRHFIESLLPSLASYASTDSFICYLVGALSLS